MAVGTTAYPTALDTSTELIQVANLASSTIGAGGVNNSATTVPVTDTTTFASDGVAWCGTEAISYTGKTGTSLTGCVRGFDNTTAASHAAADPIYGDIITSAHHEALRGAIIAIETILGVQGRKAIPYQDVAIPLTETTPNPGTDTAGYAALYTMGTPNANAHHGGLWPEEARMGFTVARRFTSGGGADGPTCALTAHIESAVATNIGVALMQTAFVKVDNGAVHGNNIVVGTDTGTTGGKMVGMEIDLQPNAGTSPSASSIGLAMNAFNVDMTNVPALFTNGSGGGFWGVGLLINGISVNGAGVTVQSGAAEMEWGIHLLNGTYGTAAAEFGGQNDKPALILHQGVSGATANTLEIKNAAGSHTYTFFKGASFKVQGAAADNAEFVLYDVTDGGWTTFSQDGVLRWAKVNSGGSFVSNHMYIDAAGFCVNPDSLNMDAQIKGDTDANLFYVDASVDSIGIGTATPTSWLDLKAGTTARAPMRIPAGTLLTTPIAGALEYTTDGFFFTGNTTNGRADDNSQQVYYLAADRTAIGGAIADYFSTNSGIPYLASSTYEIIYHLYYTKTTAGTVTYTFTTTTAPTRTKGWYVQSAAGGVGTAGTAQTAGNKGTTATTLVLPATGSLSVADHQAEVTVILNSNTAGNIRLRVTEGAGTITPLADSYVTVRRVPSGGVGTFVA